MHLNGRVVVAFQLLKGADGLFKAGSFAVDARCMFVVVPEFGVYLPFLQLFKARTLPGQVKDTSAFLRYRCLPGLVIRGIRIVPRANSSRC
jgi:hypothetical protein